MKEKFERAEIEVIEFETEDVITTSNVYTYTPQENELPLVDTLDF